MNEDNQSEKDHDIIIELRTTLKGIQATLERIEGGFTQRISVLENCKADKKDVEELYKRLSMVEGYKNIYVTMTAIAGVIGVALMGLIVTHILQTPK